MTYKEIYLQPFWKFLWNIERVGNGRDSVSKSPQFPVSTVEYLVISLVPVTV